MKRFFISNLLLLVSGPVFAGQYFQDFSAASVGATNFGDGSTLSSTALGIVASVQDATYKELQLTETGNTGVTSAFELPDLDPGTPVYAFSAKWNSKVYGNFPAAADGFSFNFGQLDSLNLIGGAVESGYGQGISFGVQTFNGNNPGFYLRVNGVMVAVVTNNSATQWGNFNGTRHFFEVDWNITNGLTARMDGQTLFTNLTTYGFVPQAGSRFVWAARSGASSEEVRLDNIVVVTGGNLVPVAASSPYYSNQGSNPSHESAKAFDGDNSTYWTAFGSTGYIGASVTNIIYAYGFFEVHNG